MNPFTKIAFFLLLVFCSVQMTFACCVGDYLRVLPSSDYIAQNPVFLLEYSGIKIALKKYKRIYLKDQRGKIIDLEVIEGYGKGEVVTDGRYTDYQNRFVLLKPKKKLQRNTVVSMVIEAGVELDERMTREIERLQQKTWKVKYKTDKRDPVFASDIRGKYYGGFNSSASGHSVRFRMETIDNYKYVPSFPANYTEEQKLKYPRKSEMLIELTDEDGKKSIYPLKDGSFSFSNGTCYRNFSLPGRLKEGESIAYIFEARLMDFSGNISEDTRLINFKILNKPPLKERKKKVTFNGIEYYVDQYAGCNSRLGPAKLTQNGRTWVNVGNEKNCTYVDVYFAETYARQRDKKTVVEIAATNNFLEQNIPNPVLGKTTIGYFLSSDSRDAFMKITDLGGRTIQSIPLREKGNSQIQINCSEMSAGIYFYSLSVEGEVMATKKMVVQ